jgi:PAS domain S-box-containing protein
VRIQARIQATLTGGRQVEGIVEKLRKLDGTPFDAKIVVQPIRFKEAISNLVLFSDLTEQEKAEEALKKSEENFHNLSENTAAGIFIVAPEGRHVYANQYACQLFQYSLEEILQRTVKDIADPAVYLQVNQWNQDRLAGKPVPATFETIARRKDGTTFPVDISITNTEWQEQTCVLVVIQDITERKEAEEALKTSEENFRNLSDNIMDGIIIVTSEGRHVYANPRACDLLKYTLEEILELSQKDLADPSAYPILKQRLQDRLAGRPVPTTYEIIARRKDGTCFPVEISGTRTIWQGQVCDLVLSRDITERKQAESALKKSEENFRNLSENTADGILIGAPNGRHVYANRQACELLEYSPEEILQTCQEDISDPAMQPLLEKRLQDRIAGRPAPKRYEINLRRKDGTYFPVEISGTRTIWQEEVSDLVLFRDITERKEAQEAIRIKNERIQEVSRQLVEVQEREKRRLASDLHDDLGQSLTSLKLMLELASSTRATNKHQKMLGSSIELISELMGKVRNLSLDLRPAMLDDFGLFATLRWLFERFHTQTGIVIQGNFDLDSEQRFPPEVETAAFRIIQEALTNVARHAGVKEAKVTIDINESLSIEIADQGTGFGYAPEAQNPTGSVGLSSMHERARLLGGQVEIVSEKGVGTRVVATIPLIGETL